MSIKIGNIDVYDIQELCKIFQAEEPTIMEFIESGRLKGQKIGDKWYVSSRFLEEFFGSDYDEEMICKIIEKFKPKLSDKLGRQGYFFPRLTPEMIEIFGILHQEHIETFDDLCKLSRGELLVLIGFDKKRLNAIESYLALIGFGLTIKSDGYKNEGIGDLNLTARASRSLRRAGIETVEELCKRSHQELLAIQGFGMTCLSEVVKKLSDMGLGLRKD